MIIFDYEQVFREAERVDEAAQKAAAVAGRIDRAMGELSRFWEGEQAQAYFRKAGRLREQSEAAARNYRALAEQMRRIAERMRELEELNMEIAGTR